MAFAQGSRSRLSYVVETSFGVTPATPTMKEIPFNTHTLDLTKERVQSAEIRSDRITSIDRHGNRGVSGEITVELRDTDFDDLFESAFFNTFDANGYLDIGTTPKFLTIEDGALDIGYYRQFVGCAVSSLRVSIAPNQMAMATFGIVGKNMNAITTTSLDDTPTAPTGGEPFDSYSGAITEGGSGIAIITAIEFTLENSLSPTYVIGDDSTPQLEYGRAAVEGQVTAYFKDDTLINKFINETSSSIKVTLDDPVSGSSYAFRFPNIKYTGASVPVQDEQSRLVTLPFVALYHSGTGTNIRLIKA